MLVSISKAIRVNNKEVAGSSILELILSKSKNFINLS